MISTAQPTCRTADSRLGLGRGENGFVSPPITGEVLAAAVFTNG